MPRITTVIFDMYETLVQNPQGMGKSSLVKAVHAKIIADTPGAQAAHRQGDESFSIGQVHGRLQDQFSGQGSARCGGFDGHQV